MKWILLLASAALVAGCAAAAKPQAPGSQADTAATAAATAAGAAAAAAEGAAAAATAAAPPSATTAPTDSAVQLRTVLAGPDDEGRLRGKIVNESRDYVAGVELTVTLDGERLAEPAFWYFGDLKYYTLAPGEAFPFVAEAKLKPGTQVAVSAVGVKAPMPATELTFAPEPAGGAQILGRLTGGSRMLKAYELNATRVHLVPLDEGGLPLPGPQGSGWALSFGADVDHLLQLADLPPGGQLVATYNSTLPEDWRATHNAIESGHYKVVVSRWRPAPDFPVSATGEILSDREVQYLTGLAPGEGQIERMTYRQYLDKYKPGDYSYDIGDDTLLSIVTTKGTSLHNRAGQYFNRHRSLMNAKTGWSYGGGSWWDPAEGPQPPGPGRSGG